MRTRSPLAPIFLIVLVDVLGLTMVIPLLPRYAEEFGASPLVATLLSSCYAACSLISSPIIGKLSDRHGRRPLLLISQGGTFIGFLILAGANSLPIIFVGRILDGVTAGNLSLAQAYISDHTAPKDRAKSFGIIGIAFGIGFMFGPAISGLMAKISLGAPFLMAAAMSATSIACTYILLPREKPPGEPVHPEGSPEGAESKEPPPPAARKIAVFDWHTYADYFKRPGFANLLAQFFLFQFAFSCFTQNFALFAERRYTHDGIAWGPTEVGYLFAYTGFLGIILQGGLIGRLVKKFGEAKLIVAGFLSAAVAYALLSDTYAVTALVGVATISAFGNGILRPTITSRITQAVGRHEQGVALGISQSLASIAMTIAPPTGGAMINQRWLGPWAIVCAGVSALGLIAALASRSAGE
ncbi:MAG TPA: MFS transporter [Kofleriaceae bacterium]|nr:MFS transporter [Kofleriaceae bacterium]